LAVFRAIFAETALRIEASTFPYRGDAISSDLIKILKDTILEIFPACIRYWGGLSASISCRFDRRRSGNGI
jgi:hypothetical protein